LNGFSGRIELSDNDDEEFGVIVEFVLKQQLERIDL